MAFEENGERINDLKVQTDELFECCSVLLPVIKPKHGCLLLTPYSIPAAHPRTCC